MYSRHTSIGGGGKTYVEKIMEKNCWLDVEIMRDTKVLDAFRSRVEKRLKEMKVFVNLKKSVEHGANGTQDYVIKKGINKGKVAK